MELGGVSLEAVAGDHAGTEFGEMTLAVMGEEAVEMLGEDQLEDGVAEELKALVVEVPAMGFVAQTGVGESFG
jgi:hypothetical protein